MTLVILYTLLLSSFKKYKTNISLWLSEKKKSPQSFDAEQALDFFANVDTSMLTYKNFLRRRVAPPN